MVSNSEPRASRPSMPKGYGIAAEDAGSGLLPWSHAEERLIASRNYWVATTRPDGRPHVMPVWGIWLNGALYFSTDPASTKGRNLVANPETVIHLESGDDAIILEGAVERLTEQRDLAPIPAPYEQKYGTGIDISNPAFGVYRLRPRVAHAWLESDFSGIATRWKFE